MRKLTSVTLTNNAQRGTFRLPKWFRSVNFAILMMLHDTCRAMMKRLTLQYIIYIYEKKNEPSDCGLYGALSRLDGNGSCGPNL